MGTNFAGTDPEDPGYVLSTYGCVVVDRHSEQFKQCSQKARGANHACSCGRLARTGMHARTASTTSRVVASELRCRYYFHRYGIDVVIAFVIGFAFRLIAFALMASLDRNKKL